MEVCTTSPLASALQVENTHAAVAGSLCDHIQLLESPSNFLPTTPSAPSSPGSCVLEAVPKVESATMLQPENIQLLGMKHTENPSASRIPVTQATLAADVAVPFCMPARLDEVG